MHALTAPSTVTPRWRGRTVDDWLPVRWSPAPGGTRLGAGRHYDARPFAPRTMRIATEMLEDRDEYVAQSATDALIRAGRHGPTIHFVLGAPRRRSIQERRGPPARGRCAGRDWRVGEPAVLPLMAAMDDSSGGGQGRRGLAIGSVLEGAAHRVAPHVFADVVARLSLATETRGHRCRTRRSNPCFEPYRRIRACPHCSGGAA